MKESRFIILLMITIIIGMLCISHVFAQPKESKPTLTHNQIAGQAYLNTNASQLNGTIITPHLEQRIVPGKNVLWCSTFQLAWNELYKLNSGPIRLRPASPTADILNKRSASRTDIDDASYVAMAGFAEDGLVKKIHQELRRKFHGQESPYLLKNMPSSGLISYGYLSKSLPFEWAFERFSNRLTFQGMCVENFGIAEYLPVDQPSEAVMAKQISVIDYKDSDDFIIELKTLQEDEHVILAKVIPQRTLQETVQMVQKRMSEAKPKEMVEGTSLFIPVLDFDLTKRYEEVTGRLIESTNERLNDQPIVAAIQSIRFSLDEKGATLKSESMMLLGGTPQGNLVFNKPFLVLLQRKGAKNPYFVLWVGNTELLLPVGAGK